MADLVACLSSGKGTWSPVIQLLKREEFDNVYLVTNQFGEENFTPPEKVELIVLEEEMSIVEMKEEIKQELQDELSGTQVGLNMTSGTGNEHMAVISAILELGYGIRLVIPGEDGFEEI